LYITFHRKNEEDALTENRESMKAPKSSWMALARWTTGAAAVMLRAAGQHRILCYHLGELTTHTVYECELVGLLLATELIRRNPSVPEPFSYFLDNQAAIKAPMSGNPYRATASQAISPL